MTKVAGEAVPRGRERLARRLRAAREESGLTQAQVAAELGVSRPLLIAIEKGVRPVSPAELVTFAEVYRRPVSELVRPSSPPRAIGARLRTALSSVPGAERLEESITWLERSADDYLDLLRRAKSTLPGTCPTVRSIEHLEPESAAETLAVDERNRIGAGDGPIGRLREMLELEVGIRVFQAPLPRLVAGLFVFVEPLGGCVVANSDHPAERRRWTMAHEYAHFLASRERAEVTVLGSGRRTSDPERFADAFAANFLMPRTGLARRLHELRRSGGGRVTPACLVQLAHSYRVSVQAMTLRLESLGLVRGGTWDKLNEHTFHSRAATESMGPAPVNESAEMLPLHYRTLAVQLYADSEITESQLASYLHVDIVGSRRCYQELTATRDVADDGSSQIVDLTDVAA